MKSAWVNCLLLVPAVLCAANPGLPQLPRIPPDAPFTFAVLGDNRADDTGQQPPAFFQVLQAVGKQSLALRAKDNEVSTPPLPLHKGANRLRFELGGNWLPPTTRGSAEQVAFTLESTNVTRSSDVTFQKLSAAADL
jgi:hypothetical protein